MRRRREIRHREFDRSSKRTGGILEVKGVCAGGEEARRRGDGAAKAAGAVGRETVFHHPILLLKLPDSASR